MMIADDTTHGRRTMNENQLLHYQAKLTYETDSWDLSIALETTDTWVAVDGRGGDAYEREHIPSAISLPHKELCLDMVKDLDKSKTYICYCDGIGCNASTKAALKLLTLGFTVKELMGGLDWWKRDGHATLGTEGQAGTGASCDC
jgi:rhodanese-related sulfurtransferase